MLCPGKTFTDLVAHMGPNHTINLFDIETTLAECPVFAGMSSRHSFTLRVLGRLIPQARRVLNNSLDNNYIECTNVTKPAECCVG